MKIREFCRIIGEKNVYIRLSCVYAIEWIIYPLKRVITYLVMDNDVTWGIASVFKRVLHAVHLWRF